MEDLWNDDNNSNIPLEIWRPKQLTRFTEEEHYVITPHFLKIGFGCLAIYRGHFYDLTYEMKILTVQMQNPEKGKKRTDKEEYTNEYVMSLMLEVLILQVSYVDT